jgi:hypothetical protein
VTIERRKSLNVTSTGGRYWNDRMHMVRIRCAAVRASSETRRTRSGWIAPAGSTPEPAVAMRSRSAIAVW